VGDVIRLYIIAAVAAGGLIGLAWLQYTAVQSERARAEAERAKVTIENTERFNEAADDPDAGDSWFDRLFPSSPAD
jgi:hypothetical protein